MKRATLLIVSVCFLCIAGGLFVDQAQHRLAQAYVAEIQALRDLVKAQEDAQALAKYEQIQTKWEEDVSYLNRVTNHNYTRDVSGYLRELGTTIEGQWTSEALLLLDRVEDALELLGEADYPTVENVL